MTFDVNYDIINESIIPGEHDHQCLEPAPEAGALGRGECEVWPRVRYGHVSGVDTCDVFLLQTRAVPVCGGPQHPGQDRQAALPAGPQEHHQVRVGRDVGAVTLCVLILQSSICIVRECEVGMYLFQARMNSF